MSRSISANTQYLIQATDLFSQNKLQSASLMFDAEKAFDLVCCEVLFCTLGAFSFLSQF